MINKTILLAEDNLNDVELTLRALEKNNIKNKVTISTDGVEASDYLFGKGKFLNLGFSSIPILILLDVKLPKIDGFEVLRQIRANELTKRIPVVILTSSNQEKDIINGYNLGANSYARKPVDFSQFAEAVSHLGIYWLLIIEILTCKGDNC